VKITVIGIGQNLRSDDGAGLAAVDTWRRAYPANAQHPRLQIVTAALPGLALLDMFAGFHTAVIVDAMKSGRQPGALQILTEDDLLAFSPASGTAHGWGLAETIKLGRKLGLEELPERITLIGIEIGSVSPGEGMCAEVRAALPKAAQLIEEQFQAWLNNFGKSGEDQGNKRKNV